MCKKGRHVTTPDEIRAIRERCSKATPAPWHSCTERYGPKKDFDVFTGKGWGVAYVGKPRFCPERMVPEDNAEFIAHAREDIPKLLDALEASQARVAELTFPSCTRTERL